MRSRLILLATFAMALVVSSCAGAEPAPEPGAAQEVEPTTTTTSTVPDSTEDPAPKDDPDAMPLEEYLVAMINADADGGICMERAEEDFNAEIDQLSDDFEPTPEDELEYSQRYWDGQAACRDQTVEAMAALAPPPKAAQAHDHLIGARRAYDEGVRTAVAEAQTSDDIFRIIFDPGPEILALYIAWVDACVALEDVAATAGFDAGLSCPLPPPGEAGHVSLIIEASGWTVEPSPVAEDAGAGVEITVENRTDEIKPVVIVDIFSGRTDDLPLVGGVLDESRCNQIFGDEDPDTAPANFGCPELGGEGQSIPVHDVHPGESFTFDPVGVGSHVILDFRAGEYEAGSFAVVEVVEAE